MTFLCPSPDGIHIAVGYEDGAVRIFSLLNGESNVSFNGHKSAVTVMHYDGLGARLVTGSRVSQMVFVLVFVCEVQLLHTFKIVHGDGVLERKQPLRTRREYKNSNTGLFSFQKGKKILSCM